MRTHVFSINGKSIISKKGTVMNNENGEAYIFNKKGEFFLLDHQKVSIWNMCVGIPFTKLLEGYQTNQRKCRRSKTTISGTSKIFPKYFSSRN